MPAAGVAGGAEGLQRGMALRCCRCCHHRPAGAHRRGGAAQGQDPLHGPQGDHVRFRADSQNFRIRLHVALEGTCAAARFFVVVCRALLPEPTAHQLLISLSLFPLAGCSYEMVQKKLKEVAMARGKTSSLDRLEHIEMLTYLASVAKGPVQVSIRARSCGLGSWLWG